MSCEPAHSTQTLHLAAGARAIINGALVSTREACTLEIGSGAFVLAGRTIEPGGAGLRNPRDELYLSLLDCRHDAGRLESQRERLFALIGEVVAQDCSHLAQYECAQCAAALMSGDARAALEIAARMAASRMDPPREPARQAHAYRK